MLMLFFPFVSYLLFMGFLLTRYTYRSTAVSRYLTEHKDDHPDYMRSKILLFALSGYLHRIGVQIPPSTFTSFLEDTR